jgi:hypothetical protein
MEMLWETLIGAAGNFVFLVATLSFAYLKRQWIGKQLSRLRWGLAADVWWLACDLHSIKLQADLERPLKVRDAICKASGHAQAIGMKDVVLQIQALYEVNPARKALVRDKVDAIIDYCGKLAELSQPNFKASSE